jgi:hypothetical protein
MFRQTALRFLWSRPLLYQAVQKLRLRGNVFDPNYDILFDGFPRSGNTFGALMLAVSQQNRLRVITHRHTPPPLIRAIQMNKPACLTLRRPLDAIVSWIIYTNRSPQSVIQYYSDFYQILLAHRSQFLILPFNVITGDFPLVIQLINMRFGLDLDSQFDLEACKSEVLERIDNKWKCRRGIVNVYRVARPHPLRDGRKETVRQALLHSRYAGLLERCDGLYQTYEDEFLAGLNQSHSLVPHEKRGRSYLERLDRDVGSDESSRGRCIA